MDHQRHMARHFWLLVSLWTGVILVLFLSDSWHLNQTIKKIALVEARAYLSKDEAIRLWAASHGGVYVPVSEQTPPNPYLAHVSERDIRTPQGQLLTLMNPAYMIRQVMTEYDRQHHIRGHITSLKYFREETAPDAWEKAALGAFEKGQGEVREFSNIRGESHLRIMKPLATEAQCLKCHAAQGYKVGDIRGGVSVALPMRPYMEHHRKQITAHAISFSGLWLLGGVGIWLASSKLSHFMKKHDEAKALLQAAQANNQTLIENALTGIYISQDSTIVFCNAKFAQIHGYGFHDLVGMPSGSLIHPLDRDYVVELHRKRMQGQNVPEEYEVRCITAYGRTIWVQRRNTMIMHAGRPAVLGNEIDITAKKQAEGELRASEEQLKRLVSRLIQRQEVERKTIAVEIHEEIAQSLGAIKMNMEASLPVNTQASAPGAQVMLPIIERIKEAIDLVRRLTKRLSPIMLDDLGIKTAIAALCRQAMETCNCGQIITRIDVDESRIPGELKIVIYRVLEELLTLSANHGCKKDHCAVSLDTCGGNIILAVEETGPHPAQRAGKYGQDMGMAVVKSRAESFGGALMIESGAENKHTITVSWPLDKKEQGSEE